MPVKVACQCQGRRRRRHIRRRMQAHVTVSAGSAADEEKARREAVGVLERVRDEGGPSSAEVEGPAAAGGAAWVVKRGRGCGETGLD